MGVEQAEGVDPGRVINDWTDRERGAYQRRRRPAVAADLATARKQLIMENDRIIELEDDLAQCQARLAKQDAVVQAARVLRDPYARGFSAALGEYAIWGAVQPIVDALAALDSPD